MAELRLYIRKQCWLLFCLLLLFSCDQPRQSKQTKIANKNKEEYINYSPNGFQRKYFDTNFNEVHYKSKAAYYREAYYAHGKPIADSITKDYYITGELQFIGHVVSENPDVLRGLGTWYHKNGKIDTKYTVNEKGEIVGQLLSFYESGKRKSVYNYRNGLTNGECKDYYENGNLKLSSNMIDGKQNGLTYEYYESGKLFAKFSCVKGVLDGEATEYYENGKIKSKGKYVNGSKYGLWEYYDTYGNLSYQDSKATVNYSTQQRLRSSSTTPDDAYSEGYDAGYEQGQYDGRHGKSHGYGYDDSSSYYGHYETRYQEGYEEGYDDGYSSGYSDYEDEEGEED